MSIRLLLSIIIKWLYLYSCFISKWTSLFANSLYPPYDFAGGLSDSLEILDNKAWTAATNSISERALRRLLSYDRYQKDVLQTFFQSVVISAEYNKRNLKGLSILNDSSRWELRSNRRLVTGQIVSILTLTPSEKVLFPRLLDCFEAISQVIYSTSF